MDTSSAHSEEKFQFFFIALSQLSDLFVKQEDKKVVAFPTRPILLHLTYFHEYDLNSSYTVATCCCLFSSAH